MRCKAPNPPQIKVRGQEDEQSFRIRHCSPTDSTLFRSRHSNRISLYVLPAPKYTPAGSMFVPG